MLRLRKTKKKQNGTGFQNSLFVVCIAYPIFGIIFTTFFGTSLSITGNQIWHIFIGPSGTISVLTFYLILNRSKKKFTEIL